MPQLDTTTWPPQLIWLAITFFALYLIISRIAIPRTGGVILRRRASIEGDLALAQQLKAETDAAVQAYEAALADARAKAQAIATENRNALSAEIDTDRAELDQILGSKVAVAEKQIALARNKALADVKDVAAEIATSIVAALIGAKVTKAAASEAVVKAAKQGAR